MRKWQNALFIALRSHKILARQYQLNVVSHPFNNQVCEQPSITWETSSKLIKTCIYSSNKGVFAFYCNDI